ncbi:MAG: hypothetical protein HFE91_12000 [Acutalibacter sp.]|uniref:hypothetical protein n=1 Tax=Acutalibacter sp. TaxID=1918636 RepID=UPI0021736311|nr:hypothetical protein [Acutalibacter sp.]MCI9226166.1 hypothetical protein [Acutalibacter sp.]
MSTRENNQYKKGNIYRYLCIILLTLLLAVNLCGCIWYQPLRLQQLRKFEKSIREDYPNTSVSCKYEYEAGVNITVTGPDFDDESAFSILSRLRATVSDEAFIKDLFELFEKESHDDPNWKNGMRPEIWLYLSVDGKDRYQFTAGANKEIYNSGRSPDSYTWDGYKTWYGTEIKEGEYRDITSEEVEEAINKFS